MEIIQCLFCPLGGYSGVATYCRASVTPVAAEEGITGGNTRRLELNPAWSL